MASTSDSSFPLAGVAHDGWSNEDEATATCLCGAVQLAFVSRLGLIFTQDQSKQCKGED